MTGDTFGGSPPSITCRSVLQTPHTFTRTRTSPSSGLGSGNSPYSSGFVPTFAGVRRKQAFIVPSTTSSSAHRGWRPTHVLRHIIPKSSGARKRSVPLGLSGFSCIFRGCFTRRLGFRWSIAHLLQPGSSRKFILPSAFSFAACFPPHETLSFRFYARFLSPVLDARIHLLRGFSFFNHLSGGGPRSRGQAWR